MRKGLTALLSLVLFGTGATLAQTGPVLLPAEQPVQPLAVRSNIAPETSSAPSVWLRGDYLLWWVKSAPNPVPLVTTGPFDPDTFTGAPIPAALDTAGTQILYGSKNVNFAALSGLRLEGGANLGDDDTFAIQGGAFFLERGRNTFTARSNADGNLFLGLPLRNATSGLEGVNAISFPSDTAQVFGGQAGGIQVTSSTRLWGAEANFAINLSKEANFRVTALVGFRYIDLDESMRISADYSPLSVLIPLNAPLPQLNPGDQITLSDRFNTRNQFYGGQMGAHFAYNLGAIDLGLTAKVALGTNQERISINGSTSATTAGQAPVMVPGGIFTTASNIGTFHRSEFSVVPEVGLNASVRITSWLRAQAGYSFLYWSQVVRPGNTIDRTLDQAGVPNSPTFDPGIVGTRPLPQFQQSDFWAQGLNFGLEFRF